MVLLFGGASGGCIEMDELIKTKSYRGGGKASNPSCERTPIAVSFRAPYSVYRVLPKPLKDLLRRMKVAFLMHDFRKCREVQQSMEDALASASMSIVVPIHDAPAVTMRCLYSLERYAPRAEIVLVDDGSNLVETENMIRGFISRNGWKLVRHEKPLGHSAASEAGANLTARPYLCLLNSDTVVTPWCWRLIKQAFEQDQYIGVAGPSTSSSGNLQTLRIAQYLRQHWSDDQICGFGARLLSEATEPVITDLQWASGFAFFIRRAVWEQLGGFDLNLPDYGNEIELCKRVAESGYRRIWVRNAYIHHLGGQSYRGVISDEGISSRTQAALTYIKEKEASIGA
jgi:GT2 family glycosyltransferase